MPTNIKDKVFLGVIIVASFLAGLALMQAINNYKNQEEVSSAEAGLQPMKARADIVK